MTETRAQAEAGLATPKAIRTRRAVAGRRDTDLSVATTRMVAGVMAPAKVRANPAAVPATTMTETKGEAAAGLATPKAIRTRRAVAGKMDTYLSAATRRMVAGEMAPAKVRVNPAAVPAMTTTGAA